MATDSRDITFSNNSDAAFRLWGQAISNAFQQAGLVLHTDGGQINWTTVTRPTPTAAEATAGFEMFRLSDSLQGSKPVFIKVEYGINAAGPPPTYAYGKPVVYITVGNTTNGAGVLTGVVSNRIKLMGDSGVPGNVVTSGSALASGSTPLWTQGDGSSIISVAGAVSSAQVGYSFQSSGVYHPLSLPWMLCVERSRDSGGVANGDGVMVAVTTWLPTGTYGEIAPTGPTTTVQFLSFLGSGPSAVCYWPITWPMNAWGIGTSGADLYTFPMRIVTPKAQWGMAAVGSYKNDIALGTTVTLLHMGANRVYRSLSQIAGASANDNSRSYVNNFVPSGSLLMRWE